MEQHRRATLAQIRRGRGGYFEVSGDVFNMVERIGEIDENLRVHPKGEYWEITEICRDGKERQVTTAQELDGRLLERLRRISQPDWDAGKEFEAREKERERAADHKFHEEVGEVGERLAHAVRKDLNPSRIILPAGVR